MKNVKANTNFRTKQILGARLNFDSETMYLIRSMVLFNAPSCSFIVDTVIHLQWVGSKPTAIGTCGPCTV